MFEQFFGLFFGAGVDIGGEVFVESAQGDHEGGEVIGKAEGGDEVRHHVCWQNQVAQGADDEGLGFRWHVLGLQQEVELQGRVEHFAPYL